jgi:hypothetical protein
LCFQSEDPIEYSEIFPEELQTLRKHLAKLMESQLGRASDPYTGPLVAKQSNLFNQGSSLMSALAGYGPSAPAGYNTGQKMATDDMSVINVMGSATSPGDRTGGGQPREPVGGGGGGKGGDPRTGVASVQGGSYYPSTQIAGYGDQNLGAPQTTGGYPSVYAPSQIPGGGGNLPPELIADRNAAWNTANTQSAIPSGAYWPSTAGQQYGWTNPYGSYGVPNRQQLMQRNMNFNPYSPYASLMSLIGRQG